MAKTIAEIKRLLAPLPDDFKRNWCEAEGGCACAGCANHCGITYEEWQAWMKYDSQWWKKWEYAYRQAGDLTLSRRERGQPLQVAIVRWRGRLPELVLMIEPGDRKAWAVLSFYEEMIEGE